MSSVVSSRLPTQSSLINVMSAAVLKAARGIIRDFNEVEHLQVSQKGPGNFVTNADLRSEKLLKYELYKARPKYGFLMEEQGEVMGEDPDYRWIVDPLDGTTNFLHGIPHFSISVALERRQEIIAGVIFDPLKNEMFWAEKGMGAFVNDRRLRVSSRRNIDEALIGTEMSYNREGFDAKSYTHILQTILTKTGGVRKLGSAALNLAYVASGRLEAFFEKGLGPWDIAAGALIVREAGGYVTEVDGGHQMLESGSVLATNQHLHATMLQLMKDFV